MSEFFKPQFSNYKLFDLILYYLLTLILLYVLHNELLCGSTMTQPISTDR